MKKNKRGRPTIDNKRVTVVATVDPKTRAAMEKARKGKNGLSFGKQIDKGIMGE
jgi:hypothetical protein